ncbi:MAG: response regulator [Deltaproteobacteria bacterium]|nr:response regulator [Deltaproteobacteria bacterium]
MQKEPYTILVVDDEETIRNILKRSLEKEKYRVLTAAEPAAAFDVLRVSKVDLIISDYMMPNMTGLEFIKKVRAMYPGILRIMLTAHAAVDMIVSAINDGEIYRFLLKPWDDMDLKILLKNAFEKIELERENRLLLMTVKKQSEVLKKLEDENPGITELHKDESGALVIDDVDMAELKDLLGKMK